MKTTVSSKTRAKTLVRRRDIEARCTGRSLLVLSHATQIRHLQDARHAGILEEDMDLADHGYSLLKEWQV